MSLSGLGVPWWLVAEPRGAAAPVHDREGRRRLLMAALFLVAGVLALGSLATVWLARSELRVARLRSDFAATVSHEFRSPTWPPPLATPISSPATTPNSPTETTGGPWTRTCSSPAFLSRPLLLQAGNTGKWSDPYGEFLAAVAAGPMYELLGKQAPGTTDFPVTGEPILHNLAYSMHDGGHRTPRRLPRLRALHPTAPAETVTPEWARPGFFSRTREHRQLPRRPPHPLRPA